MTACYRMHSQVQSFSDWVMTFEVLSRVGWLSSLSVSTRKRLLAVAELRRVPAGSTLYRVEDPPGGIYGIAAGFVDVLAAPGPFQMRLVHVASVGWWVGEAAAVSQSERRVELKTRTAVAAAYISAQGLERLALHDPSLWRDIAALTVRHLDTTMLYAASFASADLKLRLLVTLMRIVGPASELRSSLDFPVTQSDIAELTGLSRNTVSRLLGRLAEDRIIERNYRSITINVSRLKVVLGRQSQRVT